MNKTIKMQLLSALFAAILCGLSLITIPSPTGIPITFQTFAVTMCGFCLGWKYGTVSIIIYLFAGFLGLPVFSGITAGIGVLFGITGGFLLGFIPLVVLCGISDKNPHRIIYAMSGLIICHLLGIIWFILIMKSNIITAITTVSLPYLVKDIISVLAAAVLSDILKKRINLTSNQVGV